MMWNSIQINHNNVEHQTEKATLIKMPNNSIYAGFVFWHPSKLVRNGKHKSALSVSFTDEFEFNLKKYGKGKYNSRDVIREEKITASEMLEIFGVINDNISAPKVDTESYLHVKEPQPINKNVEIEPCLQNS